MFIALVVDAVWVVSRQFLGLGFSNFSILTTLQSVWRRDSASLRYCWYSKWSSSRQLLVFQYYYKAYEDPSSIRTMVNALLSNLCRYHWRKYVRSGSSGAYFFRKSCFTHKSQTWFLLHPDFLRPSTSPATLICSIDCSSPTLGTTRPWISYLCTSYIWFVCPNQCSIGLISLHCSVVLLYAFSSRLNVQIAENVLFTDTGDIDRVYLSLNLHPSLSYWRYQCSILLLSYLKCVSPFYSGIYTLTVLLKISFFIKSIWTCKSQAIQFCFHSTSLMRMPIWSVSIYTDEAVVHCADSKDFPN